MNKRCSKHEPEIRRFIFNITTFVRIEDCRCRSSQKIDFLGRTLTSTYSSLQYPIYSYTIDFQRPCTCGLEYGCDETRGCRIENICVWQQRRRRYNVRTFLINGLADIPHRRLLDSRDPKTNHATLHLLNNLTRNSLPRL